MGRAKRYIITIADDDRAPLDKLCRKLMAADGYCDVLRNQSDGTNSRRVSEPHVRCRPRGGASNFAHVPPTPKVLERHTSTPTETVLKDSAWPNRGEPSGPASPKTNEVTVI
jgi:hypothetical protein